MKKNLPKKRLRDLPPNIIIFEVFTFVRILPKKEFDLFGYFERDRKRNVLYLFRCVHLNSYLINKPIIYDFGKIDVGIQRTTGSIKGKYFKKKVKLQGFFKKPLIHPITWKSLRKLISIFHIGDSNLKDETQGFPSTGYNTNWFFGKNFFPQLTSYVLKYPSYLISPPHWWGFRIDRDVNPKPFPKLKELSFTVLTGVEMDCFYNFNGFVEENYENFEKLKFLGVNVLNHVNEWKKFKNLKILRLEYCFINIPFIQNFKQLTCLYLRVFVESNDIINISKIELTKLKKLKLCLLNKKGVSFGCILVNDYNFCSDLRKLEKLHLEDVKYIRSSTLFKFNCPVLKKLIIKRVENFGESYFQEYSFSKLRYMAICCFKLLTFQNWRVFKVLKELRIENTSIVNEIKFSLSKFPNLKILRMKRVNNFTGSYFKDDVTNIEVLEFQNVSISDTCFHKNTFNNLKKLYIRDCYGIEGKNWIKLNLEVVEIFNCLNFTDELFQNLNENIVEIYCGDCPNLQGNNWTIKEYIVKMVVHALKNEIAPNVKLENLCLSNLSENFVDSDFFFQILEDKCFSIDLLGLSDENKEWNDVRIGLGLLEQHPNLKYEKIWW